MDRVGVKYLSNDTDWKQLVKDFEAEMEKRLPTAFDDQIWSVKGLLKMVQWRIFARHRLGYFMVMVCHGYQIELTWYQAMKRKKSYLKQRLKRFSWEI